MKKTNLVSEFFKIGAMAAGGGPLILAIIYGVLFWTGTVTVLPAWEVVLGILTSMVLAFLAGGISVIYRIETLPLMWASLLHASILYLDYLIIYLVNGWIQWEPVPILVFTGIFLAGYFVIWCCVSYSIRRNIRKMNAKLTES